MLRWIPDAVVSFDYRSEIPVLHIDRHCNLPIVTFPIDDSIHSLSLTPRHDLTLLGVIIKYERVHSSNGHTWRTLESDCFPEGVLENQSRVLILTVELAGTRSQYLSQPVGAEPILLLSVDWWQNHLPALATVDPSTITILSANRDSSLPRELTSGAIAQWMNVTVEKDTIRAVLSYGEGDSQIAQREVAVSVLATDALDQTYTHLTAYGEGEASPAGLAQAIYESFSTPIYAGSIQWVSKEVIPISLASSLNLSSGQNAWLSMHGQIQECVE